MLEKISADMIKKLSNKSKKVVVIGDIMLDKYYYGDVKRISPEAPVPVLKVNSYSEVLGGAANVINNLVGLGCQVKLLSATGDDENRSSLLKLIEKIGVDTKSIFIGKNPTTTKTRLIGVNQQMIRLDFEETKPLEEEVVEHILYDLKKYIEEDNIGAIIISDYSKGICTEKLCQEVIELGKLHGIKIVVDPKGKDWSKYRGANIITPNVKEASDVLNNNINNVIEDIEREGTKLREIYDIENLLITRSEKGMSLLGPKGTSHIPTEAKEVYDVSGAGDTVIAALSAMIAKGIDIKEAVFIANIAAGIVVSHTGTYAVSKEELIEELTHKASVSTGISKLIEFDAIGDIVRRLKAKGKKVVFTNGCFDILHVGHVSYLEEAKKLGDILVLGLNSDASVKRLKGEERPINKEMDRAKMLSALEVVDYVVLFEEDTPENLIKEVRPNTLVKGGDYTVETVLGRENADEVKILTFVNGYSTTGIIEKIKKD